MATWLLGYLVILSAYGPILSLARGTPKRAEDVDVLEWVNPLIGSNSGGNVFAGATLPYGMAKAVADVNGENTGGFSTDGSQITGFSALHDSGTGGNPSLGNFPILPQICPGDELDNCNFPIGSRATHYKNDSIVAEPGYFKVALENGIEADMTVSEHAALFRFDFSTEGNGTANGTALSPLIQLDLTDLWASRQNASVSIEAEYGGSSARIKGNGTFLPSFGAGSYVAYFCLDVSGGKVKDSGVWVNNRAGTDPKELYVTRGFNLFYLEAGGFVRFQGPIFGPIYARMGLSFISTDQACQNAEKEISGLEYDFDGLVSKAKDAWRKKLAPISIQSGGVSDDQQVSFWSAVYRTMLSPQDYTGENPHWTSSEPYFDSFYCIWDMWRVQLPFLTIADPGTMSRIARSLLDIYKHRGWLPDCSMSTCKGWTQGGSDADNVLVDAYVKNLTGIDWELAYEAIVNDAENEPLEWSIEGRGGLASWKRLDYIPYLDFDPNGFGTNSRSISRTLEYSYNDYCLSTLAKGLGKETHTKYLSRAGNWQNLYKADQKSLVNGTDTGFTGFFQPKYLNGTWGYQDPIACSPLADFCSLTSNPSETFESSCWEYMFFVPHDVRKVVELLGGTDTFLKRLDYFHTSGLADIGNEPVFLTVYMPHYVGRPGLSAERAHSYIPSRFNSSTNGLPGNDDSGAMASFTLFANIGLFPNPGQNVYFIIPPFFESVSITNALTNKTATIRNLNFDAAYKRIYIQNAKLNGEVYTRNWIGHEFFTMGWTLELTLGETESDWGTREEDLPPSLSTSNSTGSIKLLTYHAG
ncbi:glycosyl hydrolase family 92-domain-containing protein [Lophiotrema nucula]|uniref:Glycosyl hydrolase family 92-domain-containing protein n=1 Tax=Lophiotrema nucula TaxID=690887 RepID=A0A6A5ZGQ5_9PLEO|nr:glycosyl hydrolase family 92-domain-containing protein [Lophiotrema nucula]